MCNVCVCVWSLVGIDGLLRDISGHSVEDDVEFFPTSQFSGTDWTVIEGIAVLRNFFCLVDNFRI